MKFLDFKITKIAAVLGLATLSLTSCLKNDNDYVQPDLSFFSVYNAATDVDSTDIIINNYYRFGPIPFGLRQNYISSGTGTLKATFQKAGSTSIADSIKSTNLNLQKDKVYSLFLVGSKATPETWVITDSLSKPDAGKANVRFVNVSADAGTLSLHAKLTADTLLFSNNAYKTASEFSQIPAGTNYTLTVKNGDNSVATLTSVNIEPNKTYTIWAKGISTATTEKYKTSIKVNENK